MDNAFGSPEGQSVGVGSADSDRRRPHRQGLDHMSSAANAGIEQDRGRPGRLHHRGQHVERRDAAVRLPPPVVGAVDSVDAAVDRPPRVVGMAYAFDDQRQLGQRAQPRRSSQVSGLPKIVAQVMTAARGSRSGGPPRSWAKRGSEK